MKNVLVFAILGGFFSLVLFYIFKEFSPFELSKLEELIKINSLAPGEWDKLNQLLKEQFDKGLIFQYLSSTAYFAFGIALAAIFSFFAAIHLFIDKLFFRSFYEKPSLFDAIRRAGLFVFAIGLMLFMKLSLLDNLYILLVPVATLVIEIILVSHIKPFVKGKIKTQPQENLIKENNLTPEKSEIPIEKDNISDANIDT